MAVPCRPCAGVRRLANAAPLTTTHSGRAPGPHTFGGGTDRYTVTPQVNALRLRYSRAAESPGKGL